MKYEVLKSCVIDGRATGAKEIISLSDESVANELMAIGRIVPYQDPEPAVEDRAIGYSHATAPRKRGRAKKASIDEG